MKTSQYRVLRLGILVLGIVYTATAAVSIVPAVSRDMPLFSWVLIIRGLVVMTIGFVITIKLKQTNEHIFFAFFLVNFAFNTWLPFQNPLEVVLIFSWALTSASFIYAMITYPGARAAQLYSGYFGKSKHPRFYKKSVLYFIRTKHFWFLFFPALLAARAVATLYVPTMLAPLNLFAIVCGLLYFRISYNLAGRADKNRLAWVLWGLTVSLLLTVIDILILFFYAQPPQLFRDVLSVLYASTICISIIMAVFFAGFLDSSLVVRRTIVYSAVFLLVIFAFSFIEHYVLYGLSVMLDIEGGMTAAFLAGFLSLAVTPIHKFLEHKLPKF
ncbi:MAG: hypothetical protein ABI778_10480 [Ignavibacteriota bacterium]